MAGDIAAKHARAEQLRQELQVLRVQQTVNMQDADVALQEQKLDDEVARLEREVAIARVQAEGGGSVVEAMEAMQRVADAEEAAATASAVTEAPVPVEVPTSVESEPEVVSEEPVAAPSLQMGLVTNGGSE